MHFAFYSPFIVQNITDFGMLNNIQNVFLYAQQCWHLFKKKKDTPITVVPNIENKSTQCLNSISFSQSSNYIMECGVLRL